MVGVAAERAGCRDGLSEAVISSLCYWSFRLCKSLGDARTGDLPRSTARGSSYRHFYGHCLGTPTTQRDDVRNFPSRYFESSRTTTELGTALQLAFQKIGQATVFRLGRKRGSVGNLALFKDLSAHWSVKIRLGPVQGQ